MVRGVVRRLRAVGIVGLMSAMAVATPGHAKGGRGANGCQASFAAAKAMRSVPAGQSQAQFMAYCAAGIVALNLTPLPQTQLITGPTGGAAGGPTGGPTGGPSGGKTGGKTDPAGALGQGAMPPVALPVTLFPTPSGTAPALGFGTSATRAAAAAAATAVSVRATATPTGRTARVASPVRRPLPGVLPSPVVPTASLLPPIPVFSFGQPVVAPSPKLRPVTVKAPRKQNGRRRGG